MAAAAWGQAPNRPSSKFDPDSSHTAGSLLRIAASHAREGQWSEAIDLYQRVIDQYGDKVAKLPREEAGGDAAGEFSLYVECRRFCHHALAHLPAEAREIYRNRYNGVAEHWFEQGAEKRDVALLRRVVDQSFCSSWGDDALDLLGDLAFQDGRFGEALANYSRLVPDHPDDPLVLVHPDPSVDLARVAAKKLLCRAAAGDYPPGPADLAEFARRYPGATGSLAGRTGELAQALEEALKSDNLGPVAQPDSRWPTFAGSFRRTKVVPGPIDVGSMQWKVELEKVSVNRPGFGMRGPPLGGTVTTAPDRLLAFHPIVLGDQVIVCDGARVLAYNLNDRPPEGDGTAAMQVEPAWKHPGDDEGRPPHVQQVLAGIPRYTLSAHGRRIYVRMGATSNAVFPGMGGMGGRGGVSSIVALDWNDQGKLIWEQRSTAIALPNRQPDRGANQRVSFEGTPVADDRSVYVAVTDRHDQPAAYIACYDAATGKSRWIRYVGSAQLEPDNVFGMGMPMQFAVSEKGDFNHRLLSLDGPTLYYQTNLGALVAIDAETGSTLWVATYPRQEVNHNGSERDLNPAVVHDGRVFIAPTDADAIFAFDAGTGRLCWKTDRISDDVKLTHLLGVAKNRLIATGDRVLLFNVETGALVRAWPDAAKSFEGFGRGLLAGDLIYWPTQNEIQVLDQRTGLLALPPIKLGENFHVKGGNLVAGDGYLIVAHTDGLVVFCQNSRLIERYRQDIALAPDRAANYFRLARAAEAVGQDQLALDNYAQAAARATSSETIDGVSLAGTARDHRFRLLMRVAGQTRRARDWKTASAALATAASVARFDPERLQAQLLLADVLLESGRPREAVDVCERLLSDERLRPLAVAAVDGRRTVRADLLIADRLSSIVRDHGRAVYESYDREAARQFARGTSEKDPRLLDLLCRAFPEALVVPDALLEMGKLHEQAGRLTDATHAYKRMLLTNSDDRHQAQALWRLAHVYEARKLVLAARDTLLDLQARFPKVRIEDADRDGPAAAVVAAELSRPRYSELAAELAVPGITLPLLRRWHFQVPEGQSIRMISACGVAPSSESGRIFVVDKGTLRSLDPATGMARWSSDLGAPARWAGYLADRLIVGTPRQIFGLELGQGNIQWRYEIPRSDADPKPDPFANVNPGDAGGQSRPSEPLTEFQIVKGRVFCLKSRRELIALDGDTGALDWAFSSPPGEINPNLWIGTDRIVLQVDKPNQLLVLRTDDGQPVTRVSLADNELFERPPVPLDDDSVLLVPDRRTVKRFDLKHGQTQWVYRESKDLPVNGPPRVVGNAAHLLVLHDGRLLIRLDPATGSKRWSTLLGMEDLSERPQAMVCDDKTFYCVNIENIYGNMREALRAVSLEDGSRLWSCHLAGPQDVVWSIALAERCVIAYPSSMRLSEGTELFNLPVILRRRDSGGLLQRFVIPAAVTGVTLKLDPKGALLATSRGMWALGSKDSGQSAGSERIR